MQRLPQTDEQQRARELARSIRAARLRPDEVRSITARREGLKLIASDALDRATRVELASALLGLEVDAATGVMPPAGCKSPTKWLCAMRVEARARVERGASDLPQDQWALNISEIAAAADVDRATVRAWRDSDDFRKAVERYAAHMLASGEYAQGKPPLYLRQAAAS